METGRWVLMETSTPPVFGKEGIDFLRAFSIEDASLIKRLLLCLSINKRERNINDRS